MRLMPVKYLPLLSLLLGAAIANSADTDHGIDIPYELFTLDNGLTLIVHEDNRAPIVAVNTWFHVGSKNEEPGRTGFAHLFEHLMFQGSENLDDEYVNFLQQLGATDLNATTWFDRTNYFETIPKNALDTVLWLESDRMGHFAGAITQDKLDEQRGVVQNEKRQGDNQPYGKVWSHILTQLFPDDHPYSWETIGSMEDLNAATLDDVKDWFATYYGPNNAVLAIAGDVDADEVLKKVQHYFGDIPPGPPLLKPVEWIPKHTTERRMTMQDRVPQSRLYKAWTGPRWGTADAIHLELATQVLSYGKNSRLYERVVYNDQTATDVGIGPTSLEIAGITYLVATAQPGTPLATVEATVNEEIEQFIKDGPTKKELTRVTTNLRASFLRGIEHVGGASGKAGVLAKNMVYGGSPDRYKQFIEIIERTTVDDLQRAAEKWLGPNAFVLEVHPYPEFRQAAGGADRSDYPRAGAAPKVNFPLFKRSKLDNGLEILMVRRTGVPLVELSMSFDAGYASDQGRNEGTASLAMSMLDEGTERFSALQISDKIATLGANLSAGSNLDTSTIRLSALTENLEPSLELFADVILNPAFPGNELERLRKRTLARIDQEKTRPMQMALRVLPPLLYGAEHPYGQPLTGSGTAESVNAIKRDDLTTFHDTWFQPGNGTLIVVGDFDEAALLKQVKKLFGGWASAPIPEQSLALDSRPSGQTVWLLDRPDSDQSIIFAGQLVPPRANPNEIALRSMNDILGGLASSRINMNLREDKGWAYGAYSTIVGARGARPLLAYAPVQTDKTKESMAEIAREINDMGTTDAPRPPEAEELEVVKRSRTLSLAGRWASNSSILAAISELVRYGLPDDYWNNYADAVNNLDLADVTDAARQVLEPDNLTWVIVGDRSKIEASIRELGYEDIRAIDADGNPIAAAEE